MNSCIKPIQFRTINNLQSTQEKQYYCISTFGYVFVFSFLCIADGRRDNSEMTLRQSRSLSWKIQRESISKIEYYNFYPFIVLLIFFLMCICRWLLPSDRARHAAMRPSATLLSNRFRSALRCNNRYMLHYIRLLEQILNFFFCNTFCLCICYFIMYGDWRNVCARQLNCFQAYSFVLVRRLCHFIHFGGWRNCRSNW